MVCPKCGKEIPDGVKFCTHCGEKMGAQAPEAQVPVPQNPVPAKSVKVAQTRFEKKQAWQAAKQRYQQDVAAKKAAKNAGKTGNGKAGRVAVKLLILLLILGVAAVGVYFMLDSLGFLPKEEKADTTKPTVSVQAAKPTEPTQETEPDWEPVINIPTGDMPAEYAPVRPDADAYFRDHSQVLEIVSAENAGSTEEEAYRNLTERGFIQQPITTQYAADGTFGQEREISAAGTERHPVYSTIFISDNGDIWVITEINGSVTANPVTFNMNEERQVQWVLSESENVTSYDSTSKKFFVTIPYSSALDVKIVESIDAEFLNSLTAWGVDAL